MKQWRFALMFLVIVLIAGCAGKTTRVAAEDMWPGYNAPDRFRVDVLTVQYHSRVADMVQKARQTNDAERFRALGPDVFELVQEGTVERADGIYTVDITFTNPNTDIEDSASFFAYRYADTDEAPEAPRAIQQVYPRKPGQFAIKGRNGYASLDVPYAYTRKPTQVEVALPDRDTYYPHQGSTVTSNAGELYTLVGDDKQYMLILSVLGKD